MLDELVDGVARRLREARVVGHTVVLRLRFDDRQTRDTLAPAGRAPRAAERLLRPAHGRCERARWGPSPLPRRALAAAA